MKTRHFLNTSDYTKAENGWQAYGAERLIEITEDMPELADGTNLLGVLLGGFTVSEDGRNVVVVGAEDNLLKGAAVQAVQNMNLALGLEELTGVL